MANKKKGQATEDNFENLEEALTKTEQYIENNQKRLSIIALVILVIAGGILSFNKFYLAPREDKVQAEIYQAQRYFEKDSFKLALNGDENYPGFLDIIENYGSTKAGQLSNYYVGISYLRTGDFNNAIKYLEDFSCDDFLINQLSIAATGDAYLELGKANKAADLYIKASSDNENGFSTPIYLQKAGMAYEIAGDYKKALKAYTRIETDFIKSSEARDIEKYISRSKLMIK